MAVMADDIKQVSIRMPRDLYEQIIAAAHQDLRSMTSEVIVLLREALEARQARDD